MNDIEDVIEYLLEMSNQMYAIREALKTQIEVIDDIMSHLRNVEED